MLKTKEHQLPIWKTSAIAIHFHGLDDSVFDRHDRNNKILYTDTVNAAKTVEVKMNYELNLG